MPTLSAAENAKLKLRRLSLAVNVSYGTRSGKYECIIAHNASPSFHDELKFVISIFRYPTLLFWHHFNNALRFEPPFFTNAFNGSLRSPINSNKNNNINKLIKVNINNKNKKKRI